VPGSIYFKKLAKPKPYNFFGQETKAKTQGRHDRLKKKSAQRENKIRNIKLKSWSA